MHTSTTAVQNPLKSLLDYGQSVWLDYIRRTLISSGELQRHIDEDGLRGMTSNPAIFEKAIAGSNDYAAELPSLQAHPDLDAKGIFEVLAIKDIQDACDVMLAVYNESNGRDGYVSLEVSPTLAHNTQGTIDEARRLWKAVSKPNLMIKVPATPEGVPAIQQLISEGTNVNVTLLFAMEAYEKVAWAYISGLEAFAASGGDVSRVASVASFFISRIDSLIDGRLEKKIHAATDAAEIARYEAVMGKIAIANAKITYQLYKQICASERWQALAAKGAQTQRLLWASTSTKNPKYKDTIYVEELIGPDTVNTIPPATFDAFRDHGLLRASLEEDVEAAHAAMAGLAAAGISMEEVTAKLLEDGVKLFADAFEKLLAAVEPKSDPGGAGAGQSYTARPDLEAGANEVLADWAAHHKMRRLWAKDATLWTGADEAKWLGWLSIVGEQMANLKTLTDFQSYVRASGYTHALLLGMGGSSLCPEVLKLTFGKQEGFPELQVLDSTDPAQVKTIQSKVDLAKTIFIVSSKSGSTLEPNIFFQYFYAEAKKIHGDSVGKHFVAVTDPGSNMQKAAEAAGFGHIFYGVPSIGGRFSALSNFGMVAAAAAGLDLAKFLDYAQQMVNACGFAIPAEKNPGLVLGAILGAGANQAHDKVTLITSPAIADLGAWLEQLLAESTGKVGKGIVPVDREALAGPSVYSHDRIFAYVRYVPGADATQDAAVDAIAAAGHPVVRIEIHDLYELGKEFFRWEIATAVAGSIIGINTFNQPDVEASKIATRELTTAYEASGSLPAEEPILVDGDVALYTDPANAAALKEAAGADQTLDGYLKAHLNRLTLGDYFAVLGYIEMNDEHEAALQAIRTKVRNEKRVATCLGFGPRFLHSTGQAYKGGPNTGVFLQVTCDDPADLPIPGAKYTFGVVKAAQARGDFQVLAERGRRALRVHLKDLKSGLKRLQAAV